MNYFFSALILTVSLINTTRVSAADTMPAAIDQRKECKDKALEKKEKIMREARKQYAKETELINQKAKFDSLKIRWYISSSYREYTKKILADNREGMAKAEEKIDTIRKNATYVFKADDSLCDMRYPVLATSTKVVTPKKK